MKELFMGLSLAEKAGVTGSIAIYVVLAIAVAWLWTVSGEARGRWRTAENALH